MNFFLEQVRKHVMIFKEETLTKCTAMQMHPYTLSRVNEIHGIDQELITPFYFDNIQVTLDNNMSIGVIRLCGAGEYNYEFFLKKLDDPTTPSYYKPESGKEVWEMMVDIWGKDEYIYFCKMNAFKYRMRAGKKEGNSIEQDIKKAMWYENKIKELNETTD